MMRILTRLKALSASLVKGMVPGSSSHPGGVGNAAGGKRANAIYLAQKEYLQLFEEMLGELLKTQREKSQAFRAEKQALRRELERAREAEVAMRNEAEVHAVQLEALLAVKRALATEVATQEAQLSGLEAEVQTRLRMEQVVKREHRVAEAKKTAFLNDLKAEEQTMRTRFMEVETEATRAEMSVRSMQHLTAKVERTQAINKRMYRVDETKYKLIQESNESSCQTTANDDGLWDYQDGLTRDVSRNVFQRMRWQALRRFASCPSCHGLGPAASVVVDKDKRRLAPCKDRAGEDPTLAHQHFQPKQGKAKKARSALDKCWAMPNVLVEFMCHLPKTAMALPIKPLRWVTREVWLILDERERIDAMDEQEGQKLQDMNDFMVELFLCRHSLRQDAELQLYIFLSSLKAHYKKSSALHTFARLMDLLNDPNATGNSGNSGAVDGYATTGHDHDSSNKEKPSKILSIPMDKKEKEPKKDPFKREEELLEQAVQPHKSPLGSAFIPVLLFTRRALLKRAKLDLHALRRENTRKRFARVATLARLQDAAARALSDNFVPADKNCRPPDVEDDGNASRNKYQGCTSLDNEKAPTASDTSAAEQQQQQATDGVGAREAQGAQGHPRGGEGAPPQSLSSARPGGPKTDADAADSQAYSAADPAHQAKREGDKVGTAPEAAALRALVVGEEATAAATNTKNSSSNNNSSSSNNNNSNTITNNKTHNNSGTTVQRRGSGGASSQRRGSVGATTPAGRMPGQKNSSTVTVGLDPKKSPGVMVMAAAADRGNKKKGAAGAAGAAGHGAHGGTKKGGGYQAQSGMKPSASSTTVAEGGYHQQDQERDSGGKAEAALLANVESIELPKHVLTEDYCTFWVSLEMAVRVLTVVLGWCTPMKRHAYMRSIEHSAALLTSRGHITGAEASHSFIRSAMRKTIAAVEASVGAGEGRGGGITETLGSIIGSYEDGCGVGGVVSGDAALHDARIVVDMDRVIELVMEVVLLRQNSIEQQLKTLFAEGDANGDGVLSYEEFTGIVRRAAPHFSERRVLRMFREALTSGAEGSFAIEKDTFCDVCRQHGLVQLSRLCHTCSQPPFHPSLYHIGGFSCLPGWSVDIANLERGGGPAATAVAAVAAMAPASTMLGVPSPGGEAVMGDKAEGAEEAGDEEEVDEDIEAEDVSGRTDFDSSTEDRNEAGARAGGAENPGSVRADAGEQQPQVEETNPNDNNERGGD